MKKRLLSAVVAATLAMSTISFIPAISVSATPETTTEVEQARTKYDELKGKVEDINTKIQGLDSQISELVIQMNDNKDEIKNLNDQIESTNTEIDQSKVEISEKEEVLGDRLREVYKSGGQTSYISIIFSADSFSDLVSKIDSASRIVNLDQEVVTDLVEEKDKLDEQVDSLETKQSDIVKLNEDINSKAEEEASKKAEQEALLKTAESEKAEFDRLYLADEERKIVAGTIATCTNSNSSTTELDNAIAQLRAIRKQIKSPTVDSEIVDAIEKGKSLKQDKAAAEEAAAARSTKPAASRGETAPSITSGNAQAILNEAYKHIGKAYVYGASGPNNFDCSGFTSYVYRVAAGIEIGRSTYDQIDSGRSVSYSELQPGDLVFPHSGHVGIYVGGGMMIHAPQTGDYVKVAPVYAFMTGRRILN